MIPREGCCVGIDRRMDGMVHGMVAGVPIEEVKEERLGSGMCMFDN